MLSYAGVFIFLIRTPANITKRHSELINYLAKLHYFKCVLKINSFLEKLHVYTLQAGAFTKSIDISNDLSQSARADYLQVLMTQQDALDSKLELVETKKEQLNAVANVYRELGGSEGYIKNLIQRPEIFRAFLFCAIPGDIAL